MFYIPTSLVPYVIIIAMLMGGFRLFAWLTRRGFVALKAGPKRHAPLATGMLARANPLRWGQSAVPATSLNTVLLRTTPGMRIWAVAINIFVNYYLWIYVPGQIVPLGWPTLAISLAGAAGCIGIYVYEARLDDDRLTIRKWGLMHREYLWRDLTSIKDDRRYEYILHFGKTEVRMPKYLVGAQGFLSFVDMTLVGNHARNARTA